jgi:hypothetical protein
MRKTSIGQQATQIPQPVHFCWSNFFMVITCFLQYLSFLSSDKKRDYIEPVSVFDSLGQLSGIGILTIDKNAEVLMQFVVPGEHQYLQSGILPDKVLEAFADRFTVHLDSLQAIGGIL